MNYVQQETGHILRADDVLFPKIDPIPSKINNNNRDLASATTGLEKCEIQWGESLTVQKVIDILNIVTSAMLLDENLLPEGSYIRQCFDGVWFTTHAIRRGFAQSKFFNGNDSWSLTFLKFWCGWSEQHSYDVIMKYLLEEVTKQEEDVFAGGRAPDRRRMMRGCPSQWQQRTILNSTASVERGTTLSNIEVQVGKIFEMMTLLTCSASSSTASPTLSPLYDPAAQSTVTGPTAYPTNKTWQQQLKWWYLKDDDFHVYVPLKYLEDADKQRLNCSSRYSRINTIASGFELYFEGTVDDIKESNVESLFCDSEEALVDHGHVLDTGLRSMVYTSNTFILSKKE